MVKERLPRHLVNSYLVNKIYWAASSRDDDIEIIDGNKIDVTEQAISAVAQYMDQEAERGKAKGFEIESNAGILKWTKKEINS